ncbi:MAG: ABC transporter substrate-binding protein [Spirochaetes bacterium]|nr:ABC transporter substrate-binding protein [Spirochaetota bacterium]MBU0954768.1 ABC transporter substrate-binding protein [Spirochaetota bacterium]
MKKSIIVLVVLLALSVFYACTPKESGGGKGPVTVASMIDSEGAVLGNMIIQLLEANGFQVTDKTEFGTPDILRKALEAGELDIVVDYTGSGQYYHEGFDPAIWSDPVRGYEQTRELDKTRKNLIWLTPAPANNTEMLALRRDFAAANNLRDMRDFAAFVNAGGKVRLIAAQSFADNPMGLAGYEAAYGFKLKEDQLILLSTGNTAEMLKALAEGINEVNVSLVYGTDGALDKLGLAVLDDPLQVPPVYLPAPVIRGPVLEAYPEIETLLKPAFMSLDLLSLQRLNAKVAYDGLDAGAVARDYLITAGLLSE